MPRRAATLGAICALAAAACAIGGAVQSRAAPDPPPAGAAAYAESCAVCHGVDLRGIPGRGPSLRGVGAQAADFYLGTGRMPLAAPGDQPLRTRQTLSPATVSALTAYVARYGGPVVPHPDPAAGSLSEGQQLFADSCAGCHTIAARGGIVTGAQAPALQQATATQIAEAVRIGPHLMPNFSSRAISDAQLDSIIRYVQWTRHAENPGGWDLGLLGPVPEGLVAFMIGLAALIVVAVAIGERAKFGGRSGEGGDA